jgi:heat shock protein HslJ
MTDEPDRETREAPAGQPEKMGPAFYAALALVGILVIMVVFLNYPAAKASAGTLMTQTNWTLQSYTDKTGILIPALSGRGVSARFARDGSMTGSAGCNQYAASYSTKDYAINITNTVSTLMFCTEPGIMDQESAFLVDLPKVFSFRVDESFLKMYDDDGKLLMVFIPA